MTPRQHELLKFIGEFIECNGHSPSYEEMMAALKLKSKSSVSRILKALEGRGYIKTFPRRPRGVRLVQAVSIPGHPAL